jgi:L-ascorbate metabolism protein UlaG (beta-lactamase superfamily)
MKIKYLAHASFLITAQNNTRIITDPYNVGQGINYSAIRESADIVTVSHGHGDHNNAKSIQGKPTIVQTAGQQTIKGIRIKGISVYHDEAKGSKRGSNLIFCFNFDEMNLCHAGDLGHLLTTRETSEIGPVDILMVPAGGFYTLPPKEVTEVIRALAPKIVIPMHYKTSGTDYPILPVDELLQGQKQVRRLNSSEIEINPGNWPSKTEIIVMTPSLLGNTAIS